VGTSVSYFGLYVTTEPVVMFRPRLAGVGAGARVFVGASQFDVHIQPFGRVELGWFYANAGWSLELLGSETGYQAIENGLLVSAGVAPRLVDIGPGFFGLDAGFDVLVKMPGFDSQLALASPLVRSWQLFPRWYRWAEYAVAPTFLRLGLLYTFTL
jgi:hypothetical protein